MSTAATTFDAKTFVIGQIKEMGGMYISDFGHIPADKVGECPMGVARNPLEFTAECAGFNMFVTSIANGTPMDMPSADERKAFYASMDTAEKACGLFKKSIDDLVAALEAVSDEKLFAPTTTPWGEPATLYKMATMTAGHIMYHDGQLNYIQSLYGDAENHWS